MDLAGRFLWRVMFLEMACDAQILWLRSCKAKFRCYYLILPVALSSFTALFISNHLFPPILEQLLEQDGIDLEAVAELAETADDEEASLRAEEDMSPLDSSDLEQFYGSPWLVPGVGCSCGRCTAQQKAS
eukprot:Skav210375  [mRNA]  locus=scaffold1526:37567:42509:+ [translate_table: standard]